MAILSNDMAGSQLAVISIEGSLLARIYVAGSQSLPPQSIDFLLVLGVDVEDEDKEADGPGNEDDWEENCGNLGGF